MNSHYWYFIVNEDMNVLTVFKKNGVLFDSYVYLNECSTKIKRIVKNMLKYAPSGRRYTFVYKENDHTFSDVKCVRMEVVNSVNGVEIWNSVPATEFFNFMKMYEIPRPDIYKGMLVFNTLQKNIDDGLIRVSGRFYFVTVDEVFVYPLRAL